MIGNWRVLTTIGLQVENGIQNNRRRIVEESPKDRRRDTKQVELQKCDFWCYF